MRLQLSRVSDVTVAAVRGPREENGGGFRELRLPGCPALVGGERGRVCDVIGRACAATDPEAAASLTRKRPRL